MRWIILLVFYFTAYNIEPQDLNKRIIDEKSGKNILIGNCTRQALLDSNFSWWYLSEYNNYDVSEIELDGLKNIIRNLTIKMVMGTWCSDSRREIPRFYKILDYLEYPDSNITLVGVNREKVGLKDEVENLEIKFVPTIIIYNDDKELGRIIETPQESLEIDLKNIIAK